MSGFKRSQPGLRFSGEKITPDEIDRYEQYCIISPTDSATWVGTCAVAGTAAEGALVLINAQLDYPRNVECVMLGTGAGMDGTMTIDGKNQFGVAITEDLAIANAENGGTTVGTKVFANVTTGTFAFGTAVGNGTVSLGVGTTGTTCIFGLPTKIAGTSDLKALTMALSDVSTTVGGGTIGAYADATNHAIKAVDDLVGTTTYVVLYKPTHDADAEANMAGL